jgi:cytochrome P450
LLGGNQNVIGYSTVILLIVAGHETTVNLIGNAMLSLFRQPEQLKKLEHQPELLPLAVEELLRFDSPVERALNRWVNKDIVFEGYEMKQGDPIILLLSAANRDEIQFNQADSLILERNPNRHLGFGKGPHYCLGAPLARAEAEVALKTLLRLPNLKLAVPETELRWRMIPMFKGLESLPVCWD